MVNCGEEKVRVHMNVVPRSTIIVLIIVISYLATAIEERVSERERPIFGAQLKAWRHKTFIFSQFVNLHVMFLRL